MRIYPPRPDKDKEAEEGHEQARNEAFRDDFDDASSVGTRRSSVSRASLGNRSVRSGRSLGSHAQGTSNLNRLRSTQKTRRIKNIHEDLDCQIMAGWIEANLTLLTKDEMLTLFTKVATLAETVDCLRITCIPKEYEIPWDQRNKPEFEIPYYKYGKRQHRFLSRQTADLLLGDLIGSCFSRMVHEIMKPIHELHTLELGVAMSDNGLAMLGDMLAANTKIERLSLCGSCIGNHGLVMLKEGLGANKSLRELDLTGCSLTDLGAKVVASILKVHSTARSDLFWREMLREYPNANEGKMKQRIFERTKMQIMSRVNVTEGGLLLLEMRENKITDEGVAQVFDAILADTRILLMGFRKNKVSGIWQENFALLMREHPTLQQVDMRGNRSASMGLLRRQSRDHSEVVLHLPASKTSAGAERWKNIPVARSRVADTYCLSLEDVLHTPRNERQERSNGLVSPPASEAGMETPGDLNDLDMKELVGQLDDVGLADATRPREGALRSALATAMPKVPRLDLGKGRSVTMMESGKMLAVGPSSAKRHSITASDGGGSESLRESARSSSRCRRPSAKMSSFKKGEKSEDARSSASAAGTRPKGNRRRKKGPQDAPADEEAMVEEMSGVLLKLHEMVSQFESVAQQEPRLMSRLSAQKAAKTSMETASRLSAAALDGIVAQLKTISHLDDSLSINPKKPTRTTGRLESIPARG